MTMVVGKLSRMELRKKDTQPIIHIIVANRVVLMREVVTSKPWCNRA